MDQPMLEIEQVKASVLIGSGFGPMNILREMENPSLLDREEDGKKKSPTFGVIFTIKVTNSL